MVTAVAVMVVVAVVGLVASLTIPTWLARRSVAKAGITKIGWKTWPIIERATAVAFDKQGTITTGAWAVISIEAIGESVDDKDTRWFAGALEHHSQHPVAQAIAQRVPRGNVQFVKELPGCGIAGLVDRHQVRVGTPDWIGVEATTAVGMIVAVEVDRRLMGTITLADEVAANIPSVIRDLQDAELLPILVTTDAEPSARELAGRAGVDRVVAGVGVTDRPKIVQELRDEHGTVVVVHDAGRSLSINDERCTVAEEANPLSALARAMSVARGIPRQRRGIQIATLVLAIAAGAATLLLG